MACQSDFTENPFRTRSDLVRAAQCLLRPLDRYKSPGRARVRIATQTGAGFSETAAQLEGFARPLWVVPDLLLSGNHDNEDYIQCWISGLKAGTDPAHPEYWGNLSDMDQRMVEMESIAFAILKLDPSAIGLPSINTNLEEESNSDMIRFRDRLVAWLSQINYHNMPENNWRWFRVFVNMAVAKLLGLDLSNHESPDAKVCRNRITSDLELLDSFYMEQGWSSDGLWGYEKKQADYYSGSFAMQFAQLLFIKLAPPDLDPARTERYQVQAREFGSCFWRYFDDSGAAIPFGRSLSYRFAFAAFWSAAAWAEVALPAPVDSPGIVKGLLLRHLRWWARQPGMFHPDGTLSIGFTYPNLFLSEDYNSPQSVYWCLKSFVVLGLPANHPFWACQELPHPSSHPSPYPQVQLVRPPRQILHNSAHHTFLLSAGQSTRKTHRGREAKYSKLAYSSIFGLSVPTSGALGGNSPTLAQIAPDSTLCATVDGGVSWSVRWEPYGVRAIESGVEEKTPVLTSLWQPVPAVYMGEGLVVETVIAVPAPVANWPGWHVRLHKIILSEAGAGKLSRAPEGFMHNLVLHDSGFAISAQTAEGHSVFETPCRPFSGHSDQSLSHGWWRDEQSCLIISEAGASGIVDLTAVTSWEPGQHTAPASESQLIRADPNTNIIASRTIIPSIGCSVQLRPEGLGDAKGNTWHLATAVFAVASSIPIEDIQRMWENKPSVDQYL